MQEEKSVGAFPIMCICGSMKFYELMLQFAEYFTSAGFIVLMPFASKRNIQIKDETRRKDHELMLDFMHKQKIDMCNVVFIVTGEMGENYIGTSTRSELEYAVLKNKLLMWSNELLTEMKRSSTAPNAL